MVARVRSTSAASPTAKAGKPMIDSSAASVSLDSDSRGSRFSSVWRACAIASAGTWMAGPSASSRAPLATSSAALAMPTELALISARPSLRLLPRSQMP